MTDPNTRPPRGNPNPLFKKLRFVNLGSTAYTGVRVDVEYTTTELPDGTTVEGPFQDASSPESDFDASKWDYNLPEPCLTVNLTVGYWSGGTTPPTAAPSEVTTPIALGPVNLATASAFDTLFACTATGEHDCAVAYNADGSLKSGFSTMP